MISVMASNIKCSRNKGIHCHAALPWHAYILNTLQGLVHLHNKGIIHRDLKASNLLLCSDATVKIGE